MKFNSLRLCLLTRTTTTTQNKCKWLVFVRTRYGEKTSSPFISSVARTMAVATAQNHNKKLCNISKLNISHIRVACFNT